MMSLVDEIKTIIPQQYTAQGFAEFVDRLEEYSQDEEFNSDAGSARKFADLVDSIINKFRNEIKGDEKIENRLHSLSILLRWRVPLALDTKWSKDLLSLSVVVAIKSGIDPFRTVQNWLDIYEYDAEPDTQRRTDALYLLTSNSEYIGSNKILLGNNESVAPTVQNWLKDYLRSSAPGQTVGGNFDKINYLTQSPNAKSLSAADKEILGKVIDIYRYLKNVPEVALENVSPRSVAIPVPKPPAPVKPVVPNIPTKTSIDQKIAQASAPTKGASIDFLKAEARQINNQVPVAPKPPVKPAGPQMTPQEIKREVGTRELPAYREEKRIPVPLQKPVTAPKVVPAQAVAAAAPVSSLNINDIRTIDDLKKINLSYMRGGNPQAQISNLKSKILNLAQANHLLPYYAVNAFEQSPLFKVYLSHGARKVTGETGNDDLTQAEFEALTDLKKEIERL
jgi:hypothetical protein